jgi:hypothetical protein
MTEDQAAAGAAELRELAGGRTDLLAETAGLAIGTAERKGPEYRARGQAVAELCRTAGADESLIPEWIEEGRRRAEARRHPPFSGGVRPLGCPVIPRGSRFCDAREPPCASLRLPGKGEETGQ